MPRIGVRLPVAVFAALVLQGCEPASVTDARTQLRRGGPRTTTLGLPIASDTFAVSEFLPETDTTTTNGLVGLRFDTDSLTVDVGNQLQFDNITFSPFSYTFSQMLQSSQIVTGAITFPVPPQGMGAAPVFPVTFPPRTRFTTPAGSGVRSATVGSGYVLRFMTNNTDCANVQIGITLRDTTGAAIVSFPSITATQGVTVIDSVNLAGVTLDGGVDVDGVPNFNGCIPTTGSVAANMTFRPLALTSVTLTNVNEGFTQSYAALASEPRVTAIDTIFVASGSFNLTLQNRLPVNDTLTVTLNGITLGGVTVTRTLTVPAAPGNGTYQGAALNIDLAGTRILPGAVNVQVIGVAKAASATITTTNATNAALVSGGGSIVVQSLSGALDPTETPELTVAVENFDEFTRDQFDFGDLEDAIRLAHLNTANATLTIVNGAQVPIVLNNFKLGVVQLDAGGQPRRLGDGSIDFEKDLDGNQILVNVVDAGQTSTLSVPSLGTKTVVLSAATVLDSLVHKLLNNTRVALAVTGNTVVGNGGQSRITRNDIIKVRFGIAVGLDITLPPTGVGFKRKQVLDGMDLSASDENDVSTKLDRATASANVVNGTPFGVSIQLSFVRGDAPGLSVDDILAMPVCTGTPTPSCRVSLVSVSVPAPTVNAAGQVVTPSNGSVAVSIGGSDVRVLFGPQFTTAVQVQLLPGAGGGGRGAIRPSDQLILNASAQVEIKSGGS